MPLSPGIASNSVADGKNFEAVARPLAADTHKFVAHRLGRFLDPTGPGR